MLTGNLMIIVCFLLIWFQAVKGDSAVHSEISLFPLVISLMVMSILYGGLTQRINYYMPCMLASPILTSTSAALLYTLIPTFNHPKWIDYQCLYSFSTDMIIQTSSLAAQAVLPQSNISTGMTLNLFTQQLKGAIFIPITQNIFASGLTSQLNGLPGLNPHVVHNTGTMDLHKVVPAQDIPVMMNAFNYGVMRAFLVAVGLSAGMLLAALTMEWKDIRKLKGGKQVEKKCVKDVEKDVVEESNAGRDCRLTGQPGPGQEGREQQQQCYQSRSNFMTLS